MRTGHGHGAAPGSREDRPNGWTVSPVDGLFELPAIDLPDDRGEIESLLHDGRHADAARAIAGLPRDTWPERERAMRAEAICSMRAGDPGHADRVLRSAPRTTASAWARACALVRLGRLVDAGEQVVWVGERVPLLGSRRRAARALLELLGWPLPRWLVDAEHDATVAGRERPVPPLHLTSFFHPAGPEVPPGLDDELAADAIQRGKYEHAARLLTEHGAGSERVARQVAVTIAECWLLAGQPAAAEAWLHHRRTSDGIWALICALVQQDRPREALDPLARLARRHALRRERREAAAALVAHLGHRSLPHGLEQLAGHPFLDARLAEEAGYRRFADKIVREIRRQTEPRAVDLVVECVEAQCSSIPDGAARSVLLRVYEAAVREWPGPAIAERGLRLVLSQPDRLGSDEAGYSGALVFATACDRLGELRAQLHDLARRASDPGTRFARLMAAAKLSLVRGDVTWIEQDTEHAITAAGSVADTRRARRLRRAAHWLTPADGPRISQWQLRPLHPLLPLAVAERLEDRDSGFQAVLEQCAAETPAARMSVDAAGRYLQVATELGDAAGRLARVRRALGFWALHIGRALLEAARAEEAIPFTGAAWRLLYPDLPGDVVTAHGRAIGTACQPLEERGAVLASLDPVIAATPLPAGGSSPLAQVVLEAWEGSRRAGAHRRGIRVADLGRLLTPASAHRPPPPLTVAAPALGDLDAIPAGVRQTLERCFADRNALLPDAPPFRGRLWFESDAAHRQYQFGREETDARNAHKAFEEAWFLEPNNVVTTHGLILGWGRRLSEKPGRSHVLDHLARVLGRMKNREVEAALAHITLGGLPTQQRERRARLELAADALQRRVRRQPWARARNAEIALRLELGDVAAAGDAAMEESLLYLPGSQGSNGYAFLAAALWQQARDAERPLTGAIEEALQRARSPELTSREAVEYAVATTGRLVALTDLALDDDALEDLWRECRGDEDDLLRFLEKQGTRTVDPRPQYLRFLRKKLVSVDPAGAARIDHLYQARGPAAGQRAEAEGIIWLRLATAELLSRDPLDDAMPQKKLFEVHVREFMAELRRCARHEVAYWTFANAVQNAMATLYELRVAAPVSAPEPYGERLARAADALQAVRWAARGFGAPAVARAAQLLFRYLALALDQPVVDDYLREKVNRLVRSRLGERLGEWWTDVCEASGPLDFFHYQQSYRYAGDVPPDEWLRTHQVHGRPVREAVSLLVDMLDSHVHGLLGLESAFHAYRGRPGPDRDAFGLETDLRDCCRVLRRALGPHPEAHELRALEAALERLGRALRRIDLGRLVDLPNLLYDSAVPTGRYLLPRAPELLDHLRRNVRGGRWIRAVCEVSDGSGRDVCCLLCLDDWPGDVPESAKLNGLAPFAELVESLGGQLHLWMARPGERGACRRQHRRDETCVADDYVPRIDERLRSLTRDRWHSQRQTVEPWLQVLDAALRTRGSANLAFVVLPSLHE